MPKTASILLVDDDSQFLDVVTAFAETKDCTVTGAASLAHALKLTAEERFDLLLLDLSLPDGDGLQLIGRLDPQQTGQVVVVTGHPTVETAVRALQLPVLDYLIKPVEGAQLNRLLDQAVAAARLRTASDAATERCGELIGASAVMARLFEKIHRVAPLDVTVLIHGESGTGKELAARALHQYSERGGRFVAVNCGAIAPDLLTSQLFGHERGSFTGAVKDHAGFFEQAQGGTLFLDECTEMPLQLQTHLLRVLEERDVTRVGASASKPVDVRVIAATNRDPLQAVRDGVLRADLYYRLMDFPLMMPPLREHPSDIALLAQHFLDRLNQRYGTERRFAPDAIRRLLDYDWPGNARELKHAVQRAWVMSGDELDMQIAQPPQHPLHQAHEHGSMPFRIGMTIEEMERQMLLRTLAHFDNDKTRTAEALGVSLKTIYNKLSRYQHEDRE
ncbi:sigma-54-dependent transcriptional regulator [Frateuria terrea]|uniref:DNA-binding transcriptional response regulator, NtrC family, contains REC, AAA-type ATPase, and a Fis-type DNA-binding domains n=1 Tax=Frateuria terrea TaxID=529704 RepID=A0A1H6SLX7_9GAMM|nr:sigma-54 dependent transcriptional regulator [Frateuria terrea]SEI68909.1 DNA-binding transcriptional response regulator, NtrC family, contains REC, AAA-type ATPase, and a Fis-type DNA-binding domains [Frateuria terrea]